ncbi:MAG: SAM-dependent methyltransferase [Betaproteobacteria bacterium]|nr:SAM-dependent methyltransferase [Betaproteobacteria bacterium]
MSSRTIGLSDEVHRYLLDNSVAETEHQIRLREETARLPEHGMQISPEQGQFLRLLLRLTGARQCLEIGTFTGYSTLCIAMAIPEDGVVTACDVSEEWTSIASRHWRDAGVAPKIFLRIAPAARTLDELLQANQAATYDFAFIDADKGGYLDYYERCLQLVRPGGLIAIDNTLWNGRPADASAADPETVAIRAFNRHVRADPRVEIALVPIGDGLTLARKKP